MDVEGRTGGAGGVRSADDVGGIGSTGNTVDGEFCKDSDCEEGGSRGGGLMMCAL